MKPFVFTLYRRGDAGISNLIMSLELGVVLARLTDRELILDGDASPKANIVSYDDQINAATPSRLTELFDIPRPWRRLEETTISPDEVTMLADWPATKFMLAFPESLGAHSWDARAFRGPRKRVVKLTDALLVSPVLGYRGGEGADTLAFYSYFFYLNTEAARQAREALSRLVPKPELTSLAGRVAQDLGPFNAVHIRRGDFKVTFGVTTLNRTPEQAIEAMDGHFSRSDPLVILTDEAEDPFFLPICQAFPHHVFIDHHILTNYRQAFLELPARDSMALALLSQLIAAQSQDFIGTMTSTFTALIQRERGLRGAEEKFKFLWNELPEPGAERVRGCQPIGDAIALNNGVMIEERNGPYSWNRFSPHLQPAWMREWPESFGERLPASTSASSHPDGEEQSFYIVFDGEAIELASPDEKLLDRLYNAFGGLAHETLGDNRLFKRLEIAFRDGVWELKNEGVLCAKLAAGKDFERNIYRQVVIALKDHRRDLLWIHAAVAATSAGAVLLPGYWGRGKTTMAMALHEHGWDYFSDDLAPLDPLNGVVFPFPVAPNVRPKTAKRRTREQLSTMAKRTGKLESNRIGRSPVVVRGILFPHFDMDASTAVIPETPGRALARLLENGIGPVEPGEQVSLLRKLGGRLAAMFMMTLRFEDPKAAIDHLLEFIPEFRSLDSAIRNNGSEIGQAMEQLTQTSHEIDQVAVRNVDLEISLVNGVKERCQLPETAEQLGELLGMLQSSTDPDRLVQLPIENGRASFSFRERDLVSVRANPPVVTEQAAGVSETHPDCSNRLEFVEIEDFLTPAECHAVLEHAIAGALSYEASTVGGGGDVSSRRSRVQSRLSGEHRQLFRSRVLLHLPHIFQTLGMVVFPPGELEVQLTRSGHGDFFKPHPDRGDEAPSITRHVTFILYLFHEPKRFQGGDLLIFPKGTLLSSGADVVRVVPRNNLLVAFDSTLWHEVEQVYCDDNAFENGRFTLNGWLHPATS